MNISFTEKNGHKRLQSDRYSLTLGTEAAKDQI